VNQKVRAALQPLVEEINKGTKEWRKERLEAALRACCAVFQPLLHELEVEERAKARSDFSQLH
jgi:hypothetical protein